MKKAVSFIIVIILLALNPVVVHANSDQDASKERGNITGTVVDSTTGEPVAGAYVGVGDFGDSSGSNYTRHRDKGFFSKGQTDEQGKFILDGLAFQEHPLVVTHPDFVRFDQMVLLEKGELEPDVKVSLKPAAKINVTIVDSAGKELKDLWIVTLKSLDGREFIPIGEDPHLSSFASSLWSKRILEPDPCNIGSITGPSEFTFNALDSGRYSIDVIQMFITPNPSAPPEGMGRIPIDTNKIRYYGGIESISIEAGQTKDIQIKPANNETRVLIKMPEDPLKRPDIPPVIMLSHDLGLLAWYDGLVHGPEDHRLGHISKKFLYQGAVVDGNDFEMINFPAGSYSVYAGPVYFASAVKIEVAKGSELTVEVPDTEPKEQSKVSLFYFDRKIKLEDKLYSLSELCDLINKTTESKPKVLAAEAIENQKIRFTDMEVNIFELIESIYLSGGWKLSEKDDNTLLLDSEK